MWHNPQTLNRCSLVLYLAALTLFSFAGWHYLGQSNLFSIRQLIITTPVIHVTPDQVNRVIHRYMTGNFISLRLDTLKNAFERLPWVRQVSIRRVWPNRLDIAIEEHEAFARWGNTNLMNPFGEIFEGASNGELPVLYGPVGSEFDVRRRYKQFAKELEPINLKITGVNLSPSYAWTLLLSNNLVIKIGKDLAQESSLQKVERFVRWYDAIERVAQPNRNIKYIDLRHSQGFAVGLGKQNTSSLKKSVNSEQI